MGFFSNLFKSELDKWIEGASHEELSTEYERQRQEWIKNGYNNGTGEITDDMMKIGNAMFVKYDEELRKKEEKLGYKRDPNFRWTDENRWEK